MDWKKFDYATPLEGVFWCVTESPEYECDVSDDGRLIGGPIDMEKPVVKLCEIEYAGDGEFYTYRDILSQRELGVEDGILKYAEVALPDLPRLDHTSIQAV